MHYFLLLCAVGSFLAGENFAGFMCLVNAAGVMVISSMDEEEDELSEVR